MFEDETMCPHCFGRMIFIKKKFDDIIRRDGDCSYWECQNCNFTSFWKPIKCDHMISGVAKDFKYFVPEFFRHKNWRWKIICPVCNIELGISIERNKLPWDIANEIEPKDCHFVKRHELEIIEVI